MDAMQLQTLLTWFAVALITLGVGGAAAVEVQRGGKLVTAWAAGDIKTLDELFIVEAKAEGGSFYEALFTNRNRNWAGRIETMLKGKGTIFIAVGAAHLIGEDSVLAMLKAKGIASERVQ